MCPLVPLNFTLEKSDPDAYQATITVSPAYVSAVYHHLMRMQKNRLMTCGFLKGNTPLTYLEYAFKDNIFEHLKEVFLGHCVLNFLYENLVEQRIEVAGEPIITAIDMDLQHGGRYTFELACLGLVELIDWKRLHFKAPTRKNYKDLDRQVESFIREESERAKDTHDTCRTGDWVLFSIALAGDGDQALLDDYLDKAWLHLSDESIDRDGYKLFFGKRVGDKFVASNDLLQEYVGNNFDHRYIFHVTILMCVPSAFFSFEHFKKNFKLRTTKELHTKLIEVFSCRHDVTQRSEMVESVLKLLLKHHPFPAPEHLVAHRQSIMLKEMQANPDYTVYKNQVDFKKTVRLLVEKQVREQILISHLACVERLQATDEDIVMYLNLIKRQRTKEFVHFKLPSFKGKGHSLPIPHGLVRYYCLQEKTLNHIIYHLTKRI